MSLVAAQISVYPLGRRSIRRPVENVVRAFRDFGVAVDPGPMSTVIAGTESSVFGALHAGFRAACTGGEAVMVVSISNACPVQLDHDRPGAPARGDRTDTTRDADV